VNLQHASDFVADCGAQRQRQINVFFGVTTTIAKEFQFLFGQLVSHHVLLTNLTPFLLPMNQV